MARNEASDMMIVAERSVSEVSLPLTLFIVIITIDIFVKIVDCHVYHESIALPSSRRFQRWRR